MKSKQNGKTKILIAEDSRTQAEQLGYMLDQHGYQVTMAANGKLALVAAQAQKPDLILSDIVMPEMDGYELCKAIKSDEKLKEIPVVLVTSLSDSQDVIRGLECGADNFIRKPYDEHYLLSRIDYLLMNLELRKGQKMQMGMEINLFGQKYFINSERQQILDLLISTYEQAVQINGELQQRDNELAHSNQVLNGLYRIADGLNQAVSEQQVAELALERALELPGIAAGWIFLREDDAGIRLAATRNLPPALETPAVLEGVCQCKRQLLAGEFGATTSIIQCERLAKAKADTQGLRYHASVPLWLGGRALGTMNLLGPDSGVFNDDELKMLYGVGNQVALALERARLHEHLEQLVEERTTALRVSEAHLRTIIEAEPECVKIVDENGRVLQMNAAGLAMIEADNLDQVQGGKITEFVVPAQREAYCAFEASVLNGKSATFEFEMVGLKGTRRWLDTHAVSLPEPQDGRPQMLAIGRDITERKQAETMLRESEEKFRAIFEGTIDGVLLAEAESKRFATGNPAICRMLGYSLEELTRLGVADIHPQQDLPHVIEQFEEQLRGEIQLAADLPVKRKDGSVFYADIKSSAVNFGDKTYLVGVFRDITRRKENEARIRRLNRIYSVLSGINTTIVRVHDEDELFREACRIAVEHGKFTFAWIGKFDVDNMKVTPAAKAGRDDGYLAQINLDAREGIRGSCALTTQALTEVKPVVCNDIASDERMAAWRSEALSRGYRSVSVFPLVVEGWPVGLFALYAAETDVFDEEEMKLLIEMAGDISFALDHLKKEQRLNYLAFYDELTGLSNRTLFYDRLKQFLHVAAENSTIVAVVVIDLERFRLINETLGRQAGDSLLKLVAERLRAAGLDTHHLSRISADCYAVVLDHLGKEADVAQFLEKDLMQAISQPFDLAGTELQVTAKAGIAFFPGDGEDAETLLRNAEAALAKAKLSGDRYLFYTPELNAQVADKLTLENKLRRALEQQQFVLHYQPKVSLRNGQIEGVEALIRWNDPDIGLVPPAQFIPLLEETGMILEVGKWALQKAMADTMTWLESGLQPPRVAVNVSSIQLRQSDFVDMVKTALNGDTKSMQYLELEITESLIMHDIEVNIQKLELIREMGATVAVDDFGTGYSSLSYIAKLPVTTLKIDRAFIINMASNPDDLSIVSAIISLAHSLNLKVVAEGVETKEQANLLRLLKCDEIQGYLFSQAVPAEQFGLFLKEKKSLSV